MTKDLSNCCGAEAKDHLSIQYPDKTPEELRGKTNYFLCMKCGEPCNLLELEPTQKLGWEEEFDEKYWLIKEDYSGDDVTEDLKAFIRKVEKEAYERGKKETRSDALREAVEKLEGMKFKPTKDMLGDNADYYERGFVKSLHYAIETLESLLTNPKDK